MANPMNRKPMGRFKDGVLTLPPLMNREAKCTEGTCQVVLDLKQLSKETLPEGEVSIL